MCDCARRSNDFANTSSLVADELKANLIEQGWFEQPNGT
jgi:hypothetical protein